MAILDERPVWSMSGGEKLSALDAAHAEIARLQVRCLHLSAGLDADGYAQEIGAHDTVQLLSVRYRLDPADVRRDLRLARALPKYPAVAAALGTGRPADSESAPTTVNLGQADAIVSALEKVPSSAGVPVEDLRVAEKAMVEAAALLPPADLRTLGKEMRERLDTDGPEPHRDEDDASSREALWIKPADRGVNFGGYLADENAELFQTLIFAGAKPHKTSDDERDPRPRSKRQADALTAILTTAAGAGSAVPGHGEIKPHITVTIDLEDLKDTVGLRGRGDLVHGDTLSAAAVRRLACGAPPAMSEAHHIIHWADGGPTSLENLALLCKRDHINVHRGHLTVHPNNGHPTINRPTWSDPDPPPVLAHPA
jgi:hypothetical protein